MSANHNNPGHPDEEAARQQAESNKRAALAGQWRTPPMPAFPTNAAATTSAAAKAAVAVAPPPVQISQLPGSTEDYAKALQEAYLRGAEAAAAMAAGMPSTASCPDFSDADEKRKAAEVPTATAPVHPSYQAPHATASHHAPQTAAPMAPPPSTVPNPLPSAPPPTAAAATGSYAQQSQLASAVPARAMSLPDMTTYAAQQEEEKRQKRLARNRASARLRRLRKKNLVRDGALLFLWYSTIKNIGPFVYNHFSHI